MELSGVHALVTYCGGRWRTWGREWRWEWGEWDSRRRTGNPHPHQRPLTASPCVSAAFGHAELYDLVSPKRDRSWAWIYVTATPTHKLTPRFGHQTVILHHPSPSSSTTTSVASTPYLARTRAANIDRYPPGEGTYTYTLCKKYSLL